MTPKIDIPKLPPPSIAAQQPLGTKPKPKSNTPSFVSAAMSPQNQSNTGGNTLLGQ